MSFGEALHIRLHNLILRLILPRWAYWLPIKKCVLYSTNGPDAKVNLGCVYRFRDLEKATQVTQDFMNDMIRTRREELSAGAVPKNDILSLMIQSAENEGKFSMTDSELVRRVLSSVVLNA